MKRLHAARRGDDGIALIMAIALMGLVGILMTTLVGIAIREGRQTSNNRSRNAAVDIAEGAVDAALAGIQGAPAGTLTCGGTTTNAQSFPDTLTVSTTVTYFDATGLAMTCPPSTSSAASQVLVRASATGTPPGGGLSVKRTMETLAALKPKYTNDLNKAIFGNAGVVVKNNFDIYGNVGPDADIYTNGDFTCSNNEHFRGSVIAPAGSITLSNTCIIDVDADARNAFTMSDTNAQVLGNVKVSNGAANITAGTVGGKVYALTSSTYCTNNPTKCTIGPVGIPSQQTFPVLNGDAATLGQYVTGGYKQWDLNGCAANDDTNPGVWLAGHASTLTQPAVISTRCRLSFPTNAKAVSLAYNVAVFADRGVSIANTITLESSTAGVKHELLLIHPADFATRVAETCTTLNPGISLSNQVTETPDISELLYSPCDIDKNNQSTVYGQIYAGGTAIIEQKTDAYYRPVKVIGVTASNVVEYYNADVLYKRENVG